jgi:hypothetical protein
MTLCVCQLMEAEGERRLGWEGSFLCVRLDHYTYTIQSNVTLKYAVFRIRIGFNADPDPDPVFYFNADPDPGNQTNADPDPDPGQPLPSHKVGFFLRKPFCKG